MTFVSMRLLSFALAFLLVAAAVRAEDEGPPSEVELQMEQISRDLKKLSRQLGTLGKKEASLALIDSALAANAACQKLTPASAGDRTGADLEEYLALYQRGLAELEACLQGLRRSVVDGDSAAAEAALDEAYALRKSYHKKLL